MESPIIGIVEKHMKLSTYPRPDRPYSLVPDEVRQAIIDHGGVPIGILSPKPPVAPHQNHSEDFLSPKEKQLLKKQLDLCQGLIFPGGRCVMDFEYTLARMAYERDMPALGICCGQTVMARALGSTSIAVDASKHERADDLYAHNISVYPETKFGKIVRVKEMQVNSRHHHSISTYQNLKVSALDMDGNIEVLEAPEKKFYIGVRFHPESLYKIDPIMDRIFQEFLKACDNPSQVCLSIVDSNQPC